MTHWGWYWKVKQQHTAKQLCETQVKLDSFALAKQPNFCAASDKFYCTTTYCDHTQTIGLIRLHCRYGGYRYYFECGSCCKRKRFLYWQGSFACRTCLNLCYRVQRERTTDRILSAMHKVERRLQKAGGARDLRPKGMHQTTWTTLRDKLFVHEMHYHHALRVELLQYYPTHAADIHALL